MPGPDGQPLCSCHGWELAGVGADQIGLQRRLPVAHNQGLDLGPGVEGLGMHPGEEVPDRLASLHLLVGADDAPGYVVGEVVGEVAPGIQGSR